jgi:hypothetical protein
MAALKALMPVFGMGSGVGRLRKIRPFSHETAQTAVYREFRKGESSWNGIEHEAWLVEDPQVNKLLLAREEAEFSSLFQLHPARKFHILFAGPPTKRSLIPDRSGSPAFARALKTEAMTAVWA